jgi:proline iminopeptidase
MAQKNSRNTPIRKYGEGDQIIIMIPGGPGLSYHYLEPLAIDLAEMGFQTWLYEPKGYPNNQPDAVPDTMEHYGHELAHLLDECKLSNPILYGQSFGGSIILDFLAKHPNYEGKVILSNTFPSGSFLKRGIQDRFQNLPETVQVRYQGLIEKEDFEGVSQIIGTEWIPRHLCRLPELPQSLLTTMGQMNDTTVQDHFIGADLFNIQGAFTAWDITDVLPQITAEVLCISGKWDYLNESINLEWMKRLPNVQIAIDVESSHVPFFENRSYYMKTVTDFIIK